MKVTKMISLFLTAMISLSMIGCVKMESSNVIEPDDERDNTMIIAESSEEDTISDNEVFSEELVVSVSEIAMNYEKYVDRKITVFGRGSSMFLDKGEIFISDSDYDYDGYPKTCTCIIEENEIGTFQEYFKSHSEKEKDIYGDIDIAVSGVCSVENDEEWDRVTNITLEKCEVIERNALTGDEGKEVWNQFQKVLFPSAYNNYYKIGEVFEQSFSPYSLSKTIYKNYSMSGDLYSILIEGKLNSTISFEDDKVQMRWLFDANTDSVMVDEYYGESAKVYEKICRIARIG